MPTYDYVCRDCGQSLEVMHGVHGAGPEACPNCGGPLRKGLSPPAIVFKGSGWAKKERTSASSGPAKADSEGDGKATKPSEAPGSAGSSEATASS